MLGHASDKPPQWAFEHEHRIRRLERAMSQVIEIEEILMINYDEINAAVAEQTTVEASTEVFIQGQKDTNASLAKQIADLQGQLAGNSDAAVNAALSGIAATIKANNAHLQTAAANVVVNTPAAPADTGAPPASGSPPDSGEPSNAPASPDVSASAPASTPLPDAPAPV